MRNNLDNSDATPRQPNILHKQIDLLYRQIPLTGIIHFLLASFIAVVMTQALPGSFIFLGWAWLILILILKYILYSRYRPSTAYSVAKLNKRYYLLCFDAFITGLTWSAGIILLAESTPIEFEIFLYIIVVALSAAAIGLAIKAGIYYIYQAALIIPVVGYLILQSQALDNLLGFFLCILVVLMWVFANQSSSAISDALRLSLQNKKLIKDLKNANTRLQMANEELTQLSATDGLTHVANRRYFEERLMKELARASRENLPLALVMLDVDFFKRYNDVLGHLSGDECLKSVAECVRDSLKRPTDIVARYGGEEFIVLLTNTTQAGAMAVGEEIRGNIESLAITHPNSYVSKYITVSVGVSGVAAKQQISRDSLLQKVDEALYQAKADGRNCVRQVSSVEAMPVQLERIAN